jgi:hypothetical protein
MYDLLCSMGNQWIFHPVFCHVFNINQHVGSTSTLILLAILPGLIKSSIGNQSEIYTLTAFFGKIMVRIL